MEPILFYKERIQFYTTEIQKLKSKLKFFPFFRLLVVIGGILFFYFLFEESVFYAFAIPLLTLVSFVSVAKKDQKLNRKLRVNQLLLEANENEIQAIEGITTAFNSGKEFLDTTHPYTSDLDIFGEGSIYQFLNRTNTFFGKNLLANSLKAPQSKDLISKRQEAVNELSQKNNWIQQFLTAGKTENNASVNPTSLIEWVKEETCFLNKSILKLVIYVLPVITVTLIVLSFYFLPSGYAVILFFTQLIIANSFAKKINELHYKTASKAASLKIFSNLISFAEKKNFNSEYLKELQKNLISKYEKVSATIKRLSSYVDHLDLKYNVYLHFPVNTLFFWDIHWAIKLEKWKVNHSENLEKWLHTIAELEVLSSFAITQFNNPDWTQPQISPDKKVIRASEVGHPLIKKNSRVVNPININGSGNVLLVTGSNMAGKSTYLRTVGVNSVLALAGAPVSAKEFTVSVINIRSSMRIIDSLQENTSSFYAELKRLKSIVDKVKEDDSVVFLLDEILRGTNSNDRHLGSAALIKQMIKYNASGILATHDLELGKLEAEYPNNINNYSFDVQIEGEELYFDYKLYPGVCKSLNASLLMKKMGIEV